MKESSKKKVKWLIIAIVALILVSICAVAAAVLIKFDKIHIKSKFIDYESTYTVPDLPSGIVDTSEIIEDSESEDTAVIEDPGTANNPGDNNQNANNNKKNTKTDNNYIKDTPIYKVEQRDKDIINILLIGRDSGRSDSMIVASYNKKNGKVVLTSYMRDSLVYIKNVGWNRLNASFAYGGPGLTINTLNQIYGLDIQNFICIDFNGFTQLVDKVGGITVNVTEVESAYLKRVYNVSVPSGDVNLNGSQALLYSRIRKGIGDDYARTERQRKVISAAISKVFNTHDAGQAISYMNTALNYVKTNLGLGDMTSLLYDFMGRDNLNIDTLRIPADGTFNGATYNGMSILKINFDKNKTIIGNKIYN